MMPETFEITTAAASECGLVWRTADSKLPMRSLMSDKYRVVQNSGTLLVFEFPALLDAL